jgi:hypothetical protein
MPSLAVGIILHGLYVSSEISLSNATQRNENEIEKEKNKKNEKNENGQEEKNENDNGTRKKGENGLGKGRRRGGRRDDGDTTRLDSTRPGRGSWVVGRGSSVGSEGRKGSSSEWYIEKASVM